MGVSGLLATDVGRFEGSCQNPVCERGQFGMPGETILVVDDVAINLKLSAILLRKEGYKVVTANDAEQALGILDSVRPDLILIDIQLPGMNGLELTRQLKKNPRTRDIV